MELVLDLVLDLRLLDRGFGIRVIMIVYDYSGLVCIVSYCLRLFKMMYYRVRFNIIFCDNML